eukprot:COSAG01_NODE_3386_length_6153_cov_89.762471_5_plen_360_part_00
MTLFLKDGTQQSHMISFDAYRDILCFGMDDEGFEQITFLIEKPDRKDEIAARDNLLSHFPKLKCMEVTFVIEMGVKLKALAYTHEPAYTIQKPTPIDIVCDGDDGAGVYPKGTPEYDEKRKTQVSHTHDGLGGWRLVRRFKIILNRRTRAGAAARFQLLTQLVGGAFVSFFYSAADVVNVIYTAQPEWQESAAYIVLTCSWFATHYARHGSLFWCVVPHLAFGVCFSNITQWNHIQERATTPVLLDVPRPKSFMAHQASACVDCAYDSVLWSICTIFLNFQTLHHILPGISHHHFLWDQQLRTAIVQFLEEEGILLKMESPGKLIAAHMSWLCEVGGKAATEGVRRCRVDCVGPPLRSN